MPPVGAEYQRIVPPLAVTPNVTVPEPHLAPGAVPVIVGVTLIVFVPPAVDAPFEDHGNTP